jgi:hypothetical protein
MLAKFLLLSGAVLVLSAVCPSSCPKNQIVEISSDTTTLVKGPSQPTLGPSTLITWFHAAWTVRNYRSARWISDEPMTLKDPVSASNRFFYKTFNLECTPSQVKLGVSADNSFWTYVNGETTEAFSEATNHNIVRIYDLTRYFNIGENTISFRVLNIALAGGTYQSNPTGLIYMLNITI